MPVPHLPSKTIQELIVQGETGAALAELTAWAQSQQQYEWVKQCILLQARWEQLQRDIIGGTLDADDLRQETNQINAAILNLLELNPTSGGTGTNNTPPAGRRPGWLWLTVAAVIVIAALALWQWNKTSENAFSWPEGQKASIAFGSGSTATWEIKTAAWEPFDAQHNKLSLHMRCSITGRYPANFWDESFRLQIDGQPPIAPQSGLNLIVEGDSFQDGDVWFVVPKNIHSARLNISSGGKTTSVAMKW